MQQPKMVEVDLEARAAYVRYAESEVKVAKQRDVTETGSVSVDFDAADVVIGVEVLWIDDPAIVTIARQWSHDHGLAFPARLGAEMLEAV